MDLIIIRHARPARQELAEGEGAADPELTDQGHAQARATGQFLHDAGIHHVAASPMNRARQTAEPLAELLRLDIELVEGLKEVDHHSSSYIPGEELTEDHEQFRIFSEDPMALFDGVGGYDVFRDDVVNAFEHLIASNRGRTVAAFCHGMVTSVYLQSILGHPDPYKMTPDYCGITRVRASSTGIRSPYGPAAKERWRSTS